MYQLINSVKKSTEIIIIAKIYNIMLSVMNVSCIFDEISRMSYLCLLQTDYKIRVANHLYEFPPQNPFVRTRWCLFILHNIVDVCVAEQSLAMSYCMANKGNTKGICNKSFKVKVKVFSLSQVLYNTWKHLCAHAQKRGPHWENSHFRISAS